MDYGINSMMGAFSPYSMYGMGGMYGMGNMYGMYGMGMMGMMPQTLAQYRNMQGLTKDVTTQQVSMMSQMNPIFGYNGEERTGFLKSLTGVGAQASSIFSPYSDENIGTTKQFAGNMAQMQMAMMMNPFAMGGMGMMI